MIVLETLMFMMLVMHRLSTQLFKKDGQSFIQLSHR